MEFDVEGVGLLQKIETDSSITSVSAVWYPEDQGCPLGPFRSRYKSSVKLGKIKFNQV